MKVWKRFGAALVTLMALAVLLTGTALAAESDSGISVQLNGAQVAFPDAVPESTGGRTFVPLRAVMEAMDAQVDYDGATGTVSIHRGGADMTMVLGQNQAAVVENGQTRTITMDVTPYVRDGRTYVPVRFVAEAFGCNVGWDPNTQTVIIVDVDALFGDATFQLMDSFAAYSGKQTNNMTMSGTLGLDVAMAGGGTVQAASVSAKGSLDGVVSDTSAQLRWALNLAGLSDLLGASVPAALEGEVRMSLDSGMAYLSLPAILTGEPADAWYSLDLNAYQEQLLSGGGLNVAQLTQLQAQFQDAGIREALVAVLQSLPMNDSTSSYEVISILVNTYKTMLSDQAFTQKGNAYVAQMTLEDMMDLTVTLTKQGDDIVAADIKMTCDVDEDGTKLAMTIDEHAASDKITLTMNMEVGSDGLNIKLDLDLSCLPTTKTPVTTLPTGEQAISLN